jgi:hypothetical protein
MKLARHNKICLNENYHKVSISEHLSHIFSVQNGSKQGDAFSPLLLNFDLQYHIRKAQESEEGLQFYATHQLVVYVYWEMTLQS